MTATPAVRHATPDDAEAIARLRVDEWRATYRGMMPDAYLDALSVDDSAVFWRRILGANSPNVTVFVADDAGAIVGFASSNVREPPKLGFTAELSAIYVQADRKRQGIGRRLVSAIAAAERAKGADGLVVFVIAGNRDARAFYENLGAELLLEQPFEWDGIPLIEAAYGWRALGALVAAGGGGAVLH
jgi:ribosomal protein S18 acetylase RimI-like enzyme